MWVGNRLYVFVSLSFLLLLSFVSGIGLYTWIDNKND